jgi:DNA-directed RNA polymerase specialized sigma24 family protein
MFNISQPSVEDALLNVEASVEKCKTAFKSAATIEEGANAFTLLLEIAHRTELTERNKVQRIEDVTDFLEPEGEIQRGAVNYAKRVMGLEGPAI